VSTDGRVPVELVHLRWMLFSPAADTAGSVRRRKAPSVELGKMDDILLTLSRTGTWNATAPVSNLLQLPFLDDKYSCVVEETELVAG
jgi:hypothetical protein